MIMRAVPLVVSAASRDMRGLYRRAKRNTVLMVLAGICFATAYVAGLIAAGAFLAPIYGPGLSALLIAAAMAVIGLVVLAVLGFLKHLDRRRNARRRSGQNLTAAAAISILPQLARSKGLLALAAVGGLAFLATQNQGSEEDA